jgi:hypothetical protein
MPGTGEQAPAFAGLRGLRGRGWQAPHRRRGLVVAAIGLCLAACHKDAPALTVASATDLGKIADAAAPNLLRDGGASILLGGKVLWTFGDTIFSPAAVDGSQLRSNTAALAQVASPLAVTEPLDAKGAPQQFVPFTAEEAAYNAQSGKPDERYALWPGAMIPLDANRALVFVDRLKVHPGTLNYEDLSTEVAIASAGSTTSTRAGTVFAAPEALFSHGAVVSGDRIYLYACTPAAPCKVARAPLAQAQSRGAYEFYTGSDWSADITRAVKTVPGSTSGFSVIFSAALGVFVAASTPGFSSEVELRTAPAPEGPWSDPVVAWTAPSAIYAVYLHPELAGAKELVVSYSRPTGSFAGEIRVIKVGLK